jgi:hypothetical protein
MNPSMRQQCRTYKETSSAFRTLLLRDTMTVTNPNRHRESTSMASDSEKLVRLSHFSDMYKADIAA